MQGGGVAQSVNVSVPELTTGPIQLNYVITEVPFAGYTTKLYINGTERYSGTDLTYDIPWERGSEGSGWEFSGSNRRAAWQALGEAYTDTGGASPTMLAEASDEKSRLYTVHEWAATQGTEALGADDIARHWASRNS